MQIVDRAMQYPAYCMWTFKTDADGAGPWLDLARDFDERHQGRMYLQVTAAQTIGEAAGMVKPEHVEQLEQQLALRDERVNQLEEQVTELQEFKRSVYVMKSAGYTQAKKPGRPPKKEVTANA